MCCSGESDSENESDDENRPGKPVSFGCVDVVLFSALGFLIDNTLLLSLWLLMEQIPAWARGPQLREALEKQFGPNRLDPDTIFPEVHTCDLEDIFDMRKKR